MQQLGPHHRSKICGAPYSPPKIYTFKIFCAPHVSPDELFKDEKTVCLPTTFSCGGSPSAQYILDAPASQGMTNCSVCGEWLADDIRFLNHMMEKHGFRNPNTDKPDRNSRGY
jgi:hypothetical protein